MFPDKANLIAVYLLFAVDKKHIDACKCSLGTFWVLACGVPVLASDIASIKE